MCCHRCGVVCYSAGFSEIGTEGKVLEEALVSAAGDLALVGPNCYGVINYIDKIALWPSHTAVPVRVMVRQSLLRVGCFLPT